MTTNSGAGWKCRQYAFAASTSTWARTARACAASSRSDSRPSPRSIASSQAANGTLASTGMVRPPDSRTTRSGRAIDRPAERSRRHAHLGVEVAVLGHPGQLDDALQLDLAPAAADLRAAQRPGQRPGLVRQLRRRPVQRRDLLPQRGVGADPVPLDLAQLALDPLQGVAGGAQQRPDRRRRVPVGRRGDGAGPAQPPADREPEQQQPDGDEHGGQVHGESMPAGTDSVGRRPNR